MKNKRILVLGVAFALLILVNGISFAQSGIEPGGYIRQSDVGKGQKEMIDVGSANSNNEIIVAYLSSSGREIWEKKARLSGNQQLHLVPTNSVFNRIVGDGVIYFDIVSSTSFRYNGALWVKASR